MAEEENGKGDRQEQLHEAFGEELGQAFEANLTDLARAGFEAYKYKISLQVPIWKKRAELASRVPKFWIKSMDRCLALVPYIDEVDRPALDLLEDVWFDFDVKDPRNFDVTFQFSGKNPYFSETTLTKSLTVDPPSSDFAKPLPYDLEAELFTRSVPVSWESPEHDLTRKAPAVDPSDVEKYDEFAGLGSFFNWFKVDGVDKLKLGEEMLEWWSSAVEYAAGFGMNVEGSERGSEDEDEDEDEDDDLNKEIDLESEEEDTRAKKRRKH